LLKAEMGLGNVQLGIVEAFGLLVASRI